MTDQGHLHGRAVTVLGGGIAGLALARACALRGARVRLLEQAPEFREVGAGLQISPNGARVLRALGLGAALEAAGPRADAVVLRDGESGGQVARLELAAHRPDAEYRLVYRPRLIALLAEGARAAGVQLVLNQRLERAEWADGGVALHLAGGRSETAPLVIGADGLHSVLRPLALGGAAPKPFFTGQIAWRAVIPCAPDAPPEPTVFMGPGRHLVSYPLGGGRRNIVAVEERRDWVEEGWNLRDDPLTLRAAFRHFAAPVQDWLEQVEEPWLWGLFRHPVAESWGRVSGAGAVAILGDAAHPTLPFLAQGANLALEDAWVLAQALDAHEETAQALAAYQAARRGRAGDVIEAANRNARNYHLSGMTRLVGHAGLRAVSRLMPDRLLGRYDWIYDHDVTAEG